MERLIQNLHAAISRHDWRDTEVAANAIRDAASPPGADNAQVAPVAWRYKSLIGDHWVYSTAEPSNWRSREPLYATPAAQVAPAEPAEGEAVLDNLREAGWMVAVHNDYRQNGQRFTFWLLTHSDGRWVKGEGPTDASALGECNAAIHTPASADREAATREAVTDEMVEAACVEAGWLAEPYTAPRESGVPIENDMSEADAAEINQHSRAVMREILEAALAQQAKPQQAKP